MHKEKLILANTDNQEKTGLKMELLQEKRVHIKQEEEDAL
jgi:hypothetical protein